MDWQPIETAPTDGRWFLVLLSTTIIGGGKPWRSSPELLMLRRKGSGPDSAGYWSSIWDHSVADSYVRNGLWAEIDALPVRAMLQADEERRLSQGGDPFDLPVPYGTGHALAPDAPAARQR